MKNRIISLALAVALLFSLVSCYKAEYVPPKDKYLTVETETVEYNEERITAICEQFADIFARIAPRIGYPPINEEKEKSIAEMLREDVAPIARTIPIYEDELSAMVNIAEEYAALSEEQNKEDIDSGFLLGLYTKFSTVVDSERLGRFTYHVQLLRLRDKLADAEEQYEKRGYGYETVLHYITLIEDAEALGEDKFSDAISVVTFMLASSVGLGDIQGGAVSLTSSDALVVMQKQAQRLESLELADADWQTVAAMCEENIPKGAESFKRKMLVALNNDNFFIGASVLMPDFVHFYAALAENATKESIDLMSSEEALAHERAIYGEIVKNEDQLRAFLDKISDELPQVGSFASSAVKAYDKAGYTAFLERPTLNVDGFVSAIKSFVDDPTESTLIALNEAKCAFIAGVNPFIAYVYLYL